MNFNYSHPRYKAARIASIKRSEGCCQFCGLKRASETHHWRGFLAGDYKSEEETTADELVALCSSCHDIATTIRKGYKEGYSVGHDEGTEEGFAVGRDEGSDEGYLEWQRFFDNQDDFEAFLEWKRDLYG